jgi:hypothetical protein
MYMIFQYQPMTRFRSVSLQVTTVELTGNDGDKWQMAIYHNYY